MSSKQYILSASQAEELPQGFISDKGTLWQPSSDQFNAQADVAGTIVEFVAENKSSVAPGQVFKPKSNLCAL